MGMREEWAQGLAALSDVETKIEAATVEIRSALGEPGRVDQRLKRLEEVVENIATVNDVILETVRSFEAIISIGLVQRINTLIEERLTVVSQLEARGRSQRRRLHLSAAAAIVLAFALAAEIYSGIIARSLDRLWEIVLPASADLGEWIERVIG